MQFCFRILINLRISHNKRDMFDDVGFFANFSGCGISKEFVCLFVRLLRKYTYGLSDGLAADWTLRLQLLTDAGRTVHAEQVVATRDQGGDHLALQTHQAVAAALPPHATRGRG